MKEEMEDMYPQVQVGLTFRSHQEKITHRLMSNGQNSSECFGGKMTTGKTQGGGSKVRVHLKSLNPHGFGLSKYFTLFKRGGVGASGKRANCLKTPLGKCSLQAAFRWLPRDIKRLLPASLGVRSFLFCDTQRSALGPKQLVWREGALQSSACSV